VRDANEQGAIDVGALPDRLPGHRSVNDVGARRELEDLWGRSLPTTEGIAGADVFDAVADGRLTALYLIGQDPVANSVLGDDARRAISAAEFVVVQDTTLTETAKLASVVLPGGEFAEKNGTFTNLERRVQRLKVAVTPPGEAKPDWQIIRDLGVALGGDFDYQDPSDVSGEIAVTVPMYQGITLSRLGSKGIQWPRVGDPSAGTESLYAPDSATGSFSLASVGAGETRVGSGPA
jgi:predicted molibdopterin-dependent oxidoreductase YjgC